MGFPWWAGLIIGIVVGIIAGAIIGFIIAKKIFERQVKANPPINANMIRALYTQMGRKPSEAQVRAIMSSVNKSK